MGPHGIKKDIYNVMTNSRELTNYCQESVRSIQSKKISDSLNNFHLKTSIDFITKSLTDQDRMFFQLNEIHFDNQIQAEKIPIYIKVIDYIETNLIGSNS
tara:strand:- start:1238 stop:1537 length:300 start_codon:yes stop_codon:yes gene_type:complete